MEIRDLRPDETPFLQEMLYTALAWRSDVELPPREWVLEHPQVAPFHTAGGERETRGLVAEKDGFPCGLAWYRLFTEDSTARASSTRPRQSSRSSTACADAASEAA